MGKDCFANFSKRYHSEAWKRFQQEQKKKRTLHYLGGNIHRVPEMLERAEYNLPIVTAFDTFRFDLTKTLVDLFGEDLWNNVRSGHLPIERVTTRLNISRTGDESEQKYVVRETYGPVSGVDIMRPDNTSKLAGRLRNAIKGLTIVNVGNGGLNQMSPEHREEALRIFSRSHKAALDVRQKVDNMRQLTQPTNIATLRGWGKHEGSPLKLFVDFDGRSFCVGRDEHNVRRVIVPQDYGREMLDLPAISEFSAEVA